MLHDVNAELTPIAHRTLSGNCRVAMWVKDNEYAIVVAKNHVRIFEECCIELNYKSSFSLGR